MRWRLSDGLGRYRTLVVIIYGNLKARIYRNLILVPRVVPLLKKYGIISTLQQENTRLHVVTIYSVYEMAMLIFLRTGSQKAEN